MYLHKYIIIDDNIYIYISDIYLPRKYIIVTNSEIIQPTKNKTK